jgi:hypothetical protein
MTYRGLCNWPPVWTHGNATEIKTVTGEVGLLKHVVRHIETPRRCFLIIDYKGEVYSGCLLFDDASFCRHIEALLQDFLGYSVKEIGDLDLGHTL